MADGACLGCCANHPAQSRQRRPRVPASYAASGPREFVFPSTMGATALPCARAVPPIAAAARRALAQTSDTRGSRRHQDRHVLPGRWRGNGTQRRRQGSLVRGRLGYVHRGLFECWIVDRRRLVTRSDMPSARVPRTTLIDVLAGKPSVLSTALYVKRQKRPRSVLHRRPIVHARRKHRRDRWHGAPGLLPQEVGPISWSAELAELESNSFLLQIRISCAEQHESANYSAVRMRG